MSPSTPRWTNFDELDRAERDSPPAPSRVNWTALASLTLTLLLALFTALRTYSDEGRAITVRLTAVETKQSEAQRATDQRITGIEKTLERMDANIVLLLQRR